MCITGINFMNSKCSFVEKPTFELSLFMFWDILGWGSGIENWKKVCFQPPHKISNACCLKKIEYGMKTISAATLFHFIIFLLCVSLHKNIFFIKHGSNQSSAVMKCMKWITMTEVIRLQNRSICQPRWPNYTVYSNYTIYCD